MTGDLQRISYILPWASRFTGDTHRGMDAYERLYNWDLTSI
jgi:hypothetical protein